MTLFKEDPDKSHCPIWAVSAKGRSKHVEVFCSTPTAPHRIVGPYHIWMFAAFDIVSVRDGLEFAYHISRPWPRL